MPVNSFDNYPMAWKPDKASLSRPWYLSLAGKLEQDIRSGCLKPDTKLPPLRELADYLDMNVSTVTRAYQMCELKGLVYGSVGRGTFVSHGPADDGTFVDRQKTWTELGMIRPFYECGSSLLKAARSILDSPEAAELFEYGDALGSDRQLRAGCLWCRQWGIDADPDRMLLTAGAQNALTAVLASLFQAGDKIAVDPFTYTNFRGLAGLFHIRLIAVESDASGMLPGELEQQCSIHGIKGVYLMPSCSNPTGIFMPKERREALAAVIRSNSLLVIEDDIYSFLVPGRAEPLVSLLPEQTVHICSVSKSLGPGLRVAFIVFPLKHRAELVNGLLNINLKTSSLNAEITAHLIETGEAMKIAERKRRLAEMRNRIYERYFQIGTQEERLHFFHWLPLPKDMTGPEFELMAMREGIHVLASHRFALQGGERPAWVRLAVTSPASDEELDRALKIVKRLLHGSVMLHGVSYIV